MRPISDGFLEIHCEDPWYSLLASGIKEVEGRKGLSKYRNLKAGDWVLFVCTDEEEKKFPAIVRKIEVYKNLDDYLRGVTLEKALPRVDNIEEAHRIYYQWSSLKEIETHGFVGIWIERKNS